MYFNNKGSILIFTLIIFSIISMITMMCIGLNYSNKRSYNLEYKETKMIENALSGIEVAGSNILKEVKINLENANSEEDFKNYFLGNNFSNKVCDMSQIDLSNVNVNITSGPKFENNEYCTFKITSSSHENSYFKKFQANVKIKNPFVEYGNNLNYENNSDEVGTDKELNFNEFKKNIDVNGLVTIDDYKEI